jgi:hypothetical protein
MEQETKRRDDEEALPSLSQAIPREVLAQILEYLPGNSLGAIGAADVSLRGLSLYETVRRRRRDYVASMGAALRAIAADDAATLGDLITSGSLGDVGEPFVLATITRADPGMSAAERALLERKIPYAYTTLLEQAAAALAPESLRALIAAGARPWPNPETPLAAAVGDVLVSSVGSYGERHVQSTGPTRPVDMLQVVDILLDNFERSPVIDISTFNPLTQTRIAAIHTVERMGRRASNEALVGMLNLAQELVESFVHEGYSPLEPATNLGRSELDETSPMMSFGLSGIGERHGSPERSVNTGMANLYRRLLADQSQEERAAADRRAAAGRERFRAIRILGAGRLSSDEEVRDAMRALATDVVMRGPASFLMIREGADWLLPRGAPNTIVASTVDSLDAPRIRLLLDGGFRAWPTVEALANELLVRSILDDQGQMTYALALDHRTVDTLLAMLRSLPRTRPLSRWDANPLTVARNVALVVAMRVPERTDVALDIVRLLLSAGYSPDERAVGIYFPPIEWAMALASMSRTMVYEVSPRRVAQALYDDARARPWRDMTGTSERDQAGRALTLLGRMTKAAPTRASIDAQRMIASIYHIMRLYDAVPAS